jgi:hypothetical protein
VGQVIEIPFNAYSAGRVRFIFSEFLKFKTKLRFETFKPPLPAVFATNDRCLN